MSKKRPVKRKTSSPSLRNKLLGSIVVAFLFGSIFGYVLIQPQIDDLATNEVVLRSEINFLNNRINELEIKESELSVSKNTIENLQTKLGSYEKDQNELSQEISVLNNQLEQIEVELEIKQDELGLTVQNAQLSEQELDKANLRLESIKSTIIKFENDKLLLVELRKEVPTTRLQAQEHWQNVKVIAIQSDPNLGTKIDRVISMINPYYDWLENQPGVNSTEAEFFNWIIEGNISGALNYTEEIGKFQNDALLTVIIRMDAALSIVS